MSISCFSFFVSTRCPDAPHQVSAQLDHSLSGDVQNMNSQHFSHIIHGEANLTFP